VPSDHHTLEALRCSSSDPISITPLTIKPLAWPLIADDGFSAHSVLLSKQLPSGAVSAQIKQQMLRSFPDVILTSQRRSDENNRRINKIYYEK